MFKTNKHLDMYFTLKVSFFFPSRIDPFHLSGYIKIKYTLLSVNSVKNSSINWDFTCYYPWEEESVNGNKTETSINKLGSWPILVISHVWLASPKTFMKYGTCSNNSHNLILFNPFEQSSDHHNFCCKSSREFYSSLNIQDWIFSNSNVST